MIGPGALYIARSFRSRSRAAALVGVALIISACATAPAQPAVTASGSPVAAGVSPSPLAVPAPVAGQTVYVASADGLGADVRATAAPTGATVRHVPDGAVLTATGGEQQIDQQTWWEVRDSTGLVGWVEADRLRTTPPPLPTPTAMLAAPTETVAVLPTLVGPTPTPAGPRPIDTLVPIDSAPRAPRTAPLPPAAPTRPATPTPVPPGRAVPTLIDPDEGGLIPCNDGSVSTTSGSGACAGHGGAAP